MIELKTAVIFIMLNIMQRRTKQSRLAEHENIRLKNCGTRQLKTPLTKLPNILLGIAKIVIKNNGFVIKFFVSKYFSIIFMLNILDIEIESPSPIMSAFTPKYRGKKIMDNIIKTLPSI